MIIACNHANVKVTERLGVSGLKLVYFTISTTNFLCKYHPRKSFGSLF